MVWESLGGDEVSSDSSWDGGNVDVLTIIGVCKFAARFRVTRAAAVGGASAIAAAFSCSGPQECVHVSLFIIGSEEI